MNEKLWFSRLGLNFASQTLNLNLLCRSSNFEQTSQPNCDVITSQPNCDVITSQPNCDVIISQPNRDVIGSQPNCDVIKVQKKSTPSVNPTRPTAETKIEIKKVFKNGKNFPHRDGSLNNRSSSPKCSRASILKNLRVSQSFPEKIEDQKVTKSKSNLSEPEKIFEHPDELDFSRLSFKLESPATDVASVAPCCPSLHCSNLSVATTTNGEQPVEDVPILRHGSVQFHRRQAPSSSKHGSTYSLTVAIRWWFHQTTFHDLKKH